MLKRIVIFFYLFSFFSNAQDISKVNLSSEKSIIDFFDNYSTNNFDPLIGIWEARYNPDPHWYENADYHDIFTEKIAIVKGDDNTYYFIQLSDWVYDLNFQKLLPKNKIMNGSHPGDTIATATINEARTNLTIKKFFNTLSVKTKDFKKKFKSNPNYIDINALKTAHYAVPSNNLNLGQVVSTHNYEDGISYAFENPDTTVITYESNEKERTVDLEGLEKYFFSEKTSFVKIYSEDYIKDLLDKNKLDPIEGIWVFSTAQSGNYGRVAIINNKYTASFNDDGYSEINLSFEDKWYDGNLLAQGQIIANIRKTSSPNVYIFQQGSVSATAIMENDGFMEVNYPSAKSLAVKEYPNSNKKIRNNNNNWDGNGSGIFISNKGYIITNSHVVEDANEIEVEFILNGEVQKFNSEILQLDKVNDLAILKIVDIDFDGVPNLPFNFKTQSSDVGTKVYAYGYPMALSLMGKEIKITDGIISSKTGLDGDITTYQISATIQPGNSGGPLFDDMGNLIGINSSGLARLGSETTGYTIKSSYVASLIDVLPRKIELPSSTKLQSLPLTEQIKEISKYVVLIKVK